MRWKRAGLACALLLSLQVARARASVLWEAPEGWGWGATSAGDVDGNGATDLLVLGAGGNLGVFLGNCDGSFATEPAWTADLMSFGDHEYGFGSADLNGDGYSDVYAIEAGFFPAECSGPCGSLCQTGRLLAWFGSGGGLPTNPSWSYFDEDGQAQQGYLFSTTTGDVNDDGYDDLLAGDIYWSPCDACAGDCESRGRVLVFEGGPGFGGLTRTIVGPPSASGDMFGDGFGHGIAVARDVDGYSGSEILVGAPWRWSTPTAMDSHGAVWIYDGDSVTPKASFHGDVLYEGFGSRVAGVGPVSPEGLHGFVVGSEFPWYYVPARLSRYEGTTYGPRQVSERGAQRLDLLRRGSESVTAAGNYIKAECASARCDGEYPPRIFTVTSGTFSQCGEASVRTTYGDSLGDVDDGGAEDYVYTLWNACETHGYVAGGETVASFLGVCNERICADGLDNDGDGHADCTDSDCVGKRDCPRYEGNCDDAVDNDHDGLLNCLDNDCEGEDGCPPKEHYCADELDNDGDALTDCDDEDCDGAPNCGESLCHDGVDNDVDEATDCADADCADECTESACKDARDNDVDGATDCADPDCAALAECREPEPQPAAQNSSDPCAKPTDLIEDCDNTPRGADVAVSPNRASDQTILLHSGQEQLDATDVFLKGRDPVVDVRIRRRHLTGVSSSISPFGDAWSFNYQQRLAPLPNGDLVHEALGRRDIFVKVGDHRWEGRLGRYETISLDAGTGVATMRTRGGNELEFDVTGEGEELLGRLRRITSARGNELEIVYESAAAEPEPDLRRIVAIEDSFGRTTHLHYDDGAHPRLLTRIVDPDDRETTYTYDGDGRLQTMRTPAITSTGGLNDFPDGREYAFSYRAATGNAMADARLANAIRAVVFPKERAAIGGVGNDARLAWTYHEDANEPGRFGRVAAHSVGDAGLVPERRAGGVFLYDYSPIGGTGAAVVTTTVVNRRSTHTEFDVDREGHLLREDVTQGRRGGNRTISAYEYDEDGDLVHAQLPLGGTSERTHASRIGNPRASHGNEVGRSAFPDARGADQSSLNPCVVYEPVFNKPYRVTSPRGEVTTYVLDYMEALSSNTADLADAMGLTEEALEDLFADAEIEDRAGDVNGDSRTDQRDGNVIRIEYPDVIEPAAQSAFETMAYNDFGQVLRTVDAEGNVTLYSYYPWWDLAGGPDSDEGTGGHLRSIIRDAEAAPGRDGGRNPTPVQQTISFEYCEQDDGAFPANTRGVPTAIVDARGVKHLFLVNEMDEVVKTIWAAELTPLADPALEPFSYEETTIRDANGNVVRREIAYRDALDGDQAPVVFEYQYDILDQLRKVTADVGGSNEVTTFDYDENGNLVERRRGVGTSDETLETWTWDDRDLPLTSTVRIGAGEISTVHYSVDDNGNVTAVSDANGQVTTFEYDGFDRLKRIVDRVGTTESLSYNANSKVTGRRWDGIPTHDNWQQVLLARSRTLFDERSRPYREDVELFHLLGRSVGVLDDGLLNPGDGFVSSVVTRDRLGRIVESVDADGHVSQFEHDGLSRLTRQVDALGNETLHAYDKAGNPTSVQLRERSNLFAAVESFLWTSEHDALNRLTKSTEPNGQQTVSEWDSRNNLVRTTDHLGNQVENRHDRLSRLVDQRTYLSATGLGATAGTADPAQGGGDGRIQLQQTWDHAGRLKTRTDDNENVTTFTYDGMGRLIRTDFEDFTFDLRTYDAGSALLTLQRQDGTILTWTHDGEGRPLSVSVAPASGVVGTLSQTWGRDGLGRVTLSTDDNGAGRDVACEFYYDSLSRLIRETQDISGSPAQVDSQWSGLSRVTGTTYPDGRILTRTHDSLGRVAAIREAANSSTIASFDFVGSRLARLVQGTRIILDKRNAELTGTLGGTDPGYDANGRDLNHVWRNTAGQTLVGLHYTYNGTGGLGTNRITGEHRTEPLGIPTGARQATYLLDSAYREVGFERTGLTSSSRTLDGANKMTAFSDQGVARAPIVDGAGLNQYSSLDSLPRLYGPNGDLRNDGTRTYLYDAFDRLVEVTSIATGMMLASFEYDAANRRATATTADAKTRYLSMGWQVVEERGGGDSVLRQYVASGGLDSHLQMLDVATGQTYYYQSTPLGTITGLSDIFGQLVEAYDYGWLGTPEMGVVGTTTVGTRSLFGNPHLFQGREWDADVELYQFRNRYYSPSIGEFTTIDPLGIWAHGMGNGYDGFGADPWNVNDPHGLRSTPIRVPALTQGARAVGGRAASAASVALGPAAMMVNAFAGGWAVGGAVDDYLIQPLLRPNDVYYNSMLRPLDVDCSNSESGDPVPGFSDTPTPSWKPGDPKPTTPQQWLDFKTNNPEWEAKAEELWGPDAAGGASLDQTVASDWAELNGMLREAGRQSQGNFGMGSATQGQSAIMGEAWVGPGFSTSSDGTTLISADGLRQYRPPTWKPRQQGFQANFESRPVPKGKWRANGHLDIADLP